MSDPKRVEPLLAEARAKLVAIQNRHEADEQIARVEQRLREELGVPLPDSVERRVVSLIAQARAGELLASAPAAVQRAPSVPPPRVAVAPPSTQPDSGPPAGMTRFCAGCGARLGPNEWNARRCTRCGLAL